MNQVSESPRLFGQPSGLFLLFFAEMWERFSYYGMRALLTFYMIKGFLGYDDGQAYKVYGAYVGLVYMTPFFGGLLADRLLGAKRAVVLGGILMAAGHLMMTVESAGFFYMALALLIVGNGFFKPNISSIVGSLYPDGDPARDGGFTIFYMGINLGAAMAPLLCGYVGETYGWHYGFGLATIGMLLGLAVFMIPGLIGQLLTMFCGLSTAAMLGASFMGYFPVEMQAMGNMAILLLLVIAGFMAFRELKREELEPEALSPATALMSRQVAMGIVLIGSVTTAIVMFAVQESNPIVQAVVAFVSIALATAGTVGTMALLKGGLPSGAGLAPDPESLHKPMAGPLTKEHLTYLGAVAVVPVVALLVNSNRSIKLIPKEFLDGLHASSNSLVHLSGTLLGEMSTPTGLLLSVTGAIALGYLMWESFKSPKVERERLWVVVAMMFFSLMFWAFFEQAGSSMNNFTDRNIDRVTEERVVSAEEVGKTIELELNQEQLGQVNADPTFAVAVNNALETIEKKREADGGDPIESPYRMKAGEPLNLTGLDALRGLTKLEAEQEGEAEPAHKVSWTVDKSNVGMGVGGTEVRATMFQSANAIFIVIFGLVFTAAWTFLGQRNMEPSTPVKFAMGLAQLGLGFVALWYGASIADGRGMVGVNWILLAYLLHTTGELCLSPVGLSMVTKLSPQRLVSTTMGAWFLATAFSGFLAAIIAMFTGVQEDGDGPSYIPVPSETVNTYGDVFGTIAIAAIGCAVVCLALSPLFNKWMHADAPANESSGAAH